MFLGVSFFLRNPDSDLFVTKPMVTGGDEGTVLSMVNVFVWVAEEGDQNRGVYTSRTASITIISPPPPPHFARVNPQAIPSETLNVIIQRVYGYPTGLFCKKGLFGKSSETFPEAFCLHKQTISVEIVQSET